MRLAIQEQHLPGSSLLEKWDAAQSYGFDAIELRSAGEFAFERRLPELRAAAAAGVVMPTSCVEMSHFVGAFSPELRADAVAQLSSQLRVMAELGGFGVITPAAYGMFSKRLPPFVPPRDDAGDHAALEDAFGSLAAVAEPLGVHVLLEPLNRYEDHMINTLGAARELLDGIGSASLGIVADTYHMNIEESDPIAAFADAGDRLLHVQLSDSNRLEPGVGHIDFAAVIDAVKRLGYAGDLAYESRLSGLAADVLPPSTRLIRGML